MGVIGFRCWVDGFTYVILDGTQATPMTVTQARLSCPADTSWSASLVWARKQVHEILRQHEIATAAIKGAEPIAQRKSLQRAELEGVIKEAVHSFLGRDCESRTKSQLRKHIGGFDEPAKYIDRALKKHGLERLQTANLGEAALAALSLLPEE